MSKNDSSNIRNSIKFTWDFLADRLLQETCDAVHIGLIDKMRIKSDFSSEHPKFKVLLGYIEEYEKKVASLKRFSEHMERVHLFINVNEFVVFAKECKEVMKKDRLIGMGIILMHFLKHSKSTCAIMVGDDYGISGKISHYASKMRELFEGETIFSYEGMDACFAVLKDKFNLKDEERETLLDYEASRMVLTNLHNYKAMKKRIEEIGDKDKVVLLCSGLFDLEKCMSKTKAIDHLDQEIAQAEKSLEDAINAIKS